MSQQPQQPIKTFRAGRGIELAVWRNEVEQNGRTVVNHSVRIQKRYRDQRTGDWKNSDYLFTDDLPRVSLAVNRAFEWIALTESDDETQFPPPGA